MLTHVHTALIANELPLLPYGGGDSHTSPPQSCCKQPTDQRNAITGGARNQRVPLACIY